jgi:hypothetical protein
MHSTVRARSGHEALGMVDRHRQHSLVPLRLRCLSQTNTPGSSAANATRARDGERTETCSTHDFSLMDHHFVLQSLPKGHQRIEAGITNNRRATVASHRIASQRSAPHRIALHCGALALTSGHEHLTRGVDCQTRHLRVMCLHVVQRPPCDGDGDGNGNTATQTFTTMILTTIP